MLYNISLIDYFEETIAKHPEKEAIICGDNQVTFKKLYSYSNSLAYKISQEVNSIKNPVAVFLPKSIESIAADIAITISGNAYMNIDIKAPNIRIQNIFKKIRPALIITDEKGLGLLKTLNIECNFILVELIDKNEDNFQKLLKRNLARIIDTDPYCIINTSGSTGTPKGVVLNQRSFIDFSLWAIETLQIKDNEVIGSLSPLVFDIYSFELCMLMVNGSTIVIIPENLSAFPASILGILKAANVTFIFWVPTIMVNIANMDLLSKIELPNLKTVWFAGEVFPTKQFNYWKKYLETTMFVNLYGPIEITLDCTYFIVNRSFNDNEPLPIGIPCRNTDIIILTEKNQPAKVDEEGELCVRGSSLAMGYYNDPEKTAESFIQNPLNSNYPEIIYRTGDIVTQNSGGEILFKGRKDSLIKHLGYRIELGEIEHVLVNSLKLINNGCVVYNGSRKEITLFYESPQSIDIREFKRSLSNVLPKYMVPAVYKRLDQLPRNINGKIDRLLLTRIVNDDQNI